MLWNTMEVVRDACDDVEGKGADIFVVTNTGKILTILGLMLGASGCASKKVAPWRPGIAVQWSDISTQSILRPENGFHILTQKPTQGLFPTSMAVTRVAIAEGHGPVPRARSVLLSDPRNEFLQWNSALDDQLAVSEVFPIVQTNMGGARVAPLKILAASRALKARLGMIYAINEISEHETELLGVLYDTRAAKPVAVLHARARSALPQTKKEETSTTPWEFDSHAIVRARFERLLNQCIRELILNDRPAPTVRRTSSRSSNRTRHVQWPPN